MRLFYLFLIVAQLFSTILNAQSFDSLSFRIGTTATYASKKYQPFWIVTNQYGTISDIKGDLSTHIQFSNKHVVARKKQNNFSSENTKRNGFYFRYGADFYNNNHFRNTLIIEAYFKSGFKTWELRGGRYKEIIGEVDLELSSGSFGVSNNAVPIPKVGIVVTEYTNVPFTKEWLQFKGQFSHGWLGNTNYLKGAFLHQKSFYIRTGKNQLHFFGGLTHFAQWGGTHPLGKAPNRLKDYLRIIVGAAGDGSDPIYHQGPIDIVNAVGNHLIIPDFGVTFRNNKSVFQLYTQTIFEKGKGRGSSERDRLTGLKILSRDRLVGLSWETAANSLLKKIVLEGIYTKYQGGSIIYIGRDNYYNNATYQTGWEYHGQIIGTPLFINYKKASQYHLGTNNDYLGGWNIVSNRIIGIHFGIKGRINKNMFFRTLGTYVQHYGNYYNDAAFTPYKNQSFFLFESSYKLKMGLTIITGIGKDFGVLSKSFGSFLKLQWNIKD